MGAELQGASLLGAELQGASLNQAQLQGASLGGAQLQGASLGGAQLQGASLDRTGIWRADIRRAHDTTLLSCTGSHFNPLTAENLDALDARLEAIPEGESRQRAQARVKVLRATVEAVGDSALEAAWDETSCSRYDPQQSDPALADILIPEVICRSDMIAGGRAVGAVGVLRRMTELRGDSPRPYHALVSRAVLEEDRCEAVREALSANDIAQFRRFLDEVEPAPVQASPPGEPAELEPDPAAMPAVPAVDDAAAIEGPSAP